MKRFGIRRVDIIDPDGWDRCDLESSFNEKITEEEFVNRLGMSTIYHTQESYKLFVKWDI